MSDPEPAPIRARGFALAPLVIGVIAFLVALLPVAGLIAGAAAIVGGAFGALDLVTSAAILSIS